MNSYDLMVMNKNGMAVYFGFQLLIVPCNQSIITSQDFLWSYVYLKELKILKAYHE